MYKYPLAVTQQFRFCGNPFRLDFYRGCDFGCKYCFANARGGGIAHEYDNAEFKIIEDYFKKAFETDKETKNINVELLRKRVPIHIGGMSDPFQSREFTLKLNYKMIELSNKYKYPLLFSTKCSDLPDEYFQILNPELHAFQISLMGYDDDFIKKYETNTPTASQRIAFAKKLKEKGFWVSIRLQPLIDMEQAIKVCDNINGIVDYITIEHLKIPVDNKAVRSLFEPFDKSLYYRPSSLRNYELKNEYKKQNIIELSKHLNLTKYGVGDNDLHFMSQSRCCCGIDTINQNFDNYLKYNLTYLSTSNGDEDKETLYTPQCNISSCLNPDSRLQGVNDYKTYTDFYCGTHKNFFETEDNYAKFYKDFNIDNYTRGKRNH